MRCFWIVPRAAAQALAVLFLASFVGGGAFAGNSLDAFGNWLQADRHDSEARDSADRQRWQMEAFEKISMRNQRSAQTPDDEMAAEPLLSKVHCFVMERKRDEFYRAEKLAYGYFMECAERCLRVELPWLFDLTSILPSVLQSPGRWDLLSISRRSWSVMDAADLETWLQHRHWWILTDDDERRLHSWGGETYLPLCGGYLLQTKSGAYDYSPIRKLQNVPVDDLLEAVAFDASNVAIEHFHIDVTHYEPLNDETSIASPGGWRLPRHSDDLPDSTFENLATSLATAPNLQDASISWQSDPHSDAEAELNVEAITTRLAKSTSVRKLSLFRTFGSCRFDSGPLAAFTRAARVSGGWRLLESLSITTRYCQSNGREKSIDDELRELQSVLEQMPALRKVHVEYRDSAAFHNHFFRQDGDQQRQALDSNVVPPVGVIVRRVPHHVSVTMKTNIAGAARVLRAATLAPLNHTLSHGYAVVASASNLTFLLGRELLLDTTALTVLPTFASRIVARISEEAVHAAFEMPVQLLPNLERLVIDSRWTGDYCNGIVERLPPATGAGLRALMVRTIQFSINNGESNVVEAVQRLLQAGRDLYMVELGISIHSCTTDEVAVLFERLGETLSQMRHLENVTLDLYDEQGCHDDGRLGVLTSTFQKVVPVARVSVFKESALLQPDDQQFDHFGDPAGWRPDLFPSPRQFYTETVGSS